LGAGFPVTGLTGLLAVLAAGELAALGVAGGTVLTDGAAAGGGAGSTTGAGGVGGSAGAASTALGAGEALEGAGSSAGFFPPSMA
jgi:hypothetical protein